MDSNTNNFTSPYEQICQKHNLPTEFVCSCNDIICNECINTHKNHENFSLRKRKELKELFLNNLKLLFNLEKKSEMIEMQDKLREVNLNIIEAFVKPTNKEQEEIDLIKSKIDAFREVNCANEEQMNSIINSNSSQFLEMIALNKQTKINKLRDNFKKNEKIFIKEYIKLFDKFIIYGLDSTDHAKTLENENNTSKKEINKIEEIFQNDDIFGQLTDKKYNFLSNDPENSRHIEIEIENKDDKNKFDISNFMEDDSTYINLNKFNQYLSLKNEFNSPKVDSKTKINLKTNFNYDSKLNSNSKNVKEISTTLSLTQSNIMIINPPNDNHKLQYDKNLIQYDEYYHNEFNSNNHSPINRMRNNKNSANIINYAGTNNKNDCLTKFCKDCNIEYLVKKDEKWRVRCLSCYKIYSKKNKFNK